MDAQHIGPLGNRAGMMRLHAPRFELLRKAPTPPVDQQLQIISASQLLRACFNGAETAVLILATRSTRHGVIEIAADRSDWADANQSPERLKFVLI